VKQMCLPARDNAKRSKGSATSLKLLSTKDKKGLGRLGAW